MTIAIAVLRCLLLLLSMALLWRMGTALWRVFRGSQSLTQQARSGQAFMALSCCFGQVFYLFYSEPIALVVALLFANTGIFLFVHVSRRAARKRMIKLDCLIDNPHLSLPLVELAELDPEAAGMLADEARRLIAQRQMG